ncbi:MAG: multidrug efflux SMR transporter [Deltaproteobacteria bacterium]|nr:multidrug efflux SMR transporter [Deltaproteobacteria bacterium]
MAWWFIFIAGLFEVAWPFALKWSVKFSRWSPLIVALVTSIPVMYLLAEAVKRLPAATVYAAFVGIGVAGTAIIGMAVFGESTNAGRICSLVLLLAGLIGLKLFSGTIE